MAVEVGDRGAQDLAAPGARGEPGDGARPQIVPVGEPSREDDTIDALEVMVLVPEENGLLMDNILEDEKRVIIAVRTGEDNNTKLQRIKPSFVLSGSPR